MPLKKVFLCHSSSDKTFVDRLASDLEKVNIGVWYDKWEIKVGDSLIEKIQAGIEHNDYLAVILSPESVTSEWVKRELNSALMKEIKEKKVAVLPCLLRDCVIPPFLAEKKYADFRNSYEDGFTDLLLTVFPESKEIAIKSKDFRVVQYLISGLTSTDSQGSNILNVSQLIKVFSFRKELKNYLGLDEKKLLFYSAVAFKSANPDTPDFINNNVPVWGLMDEVDDLIRSQWIIDGTHQKIFGYLVPYFDWAVTTNKSIDADKVGIASVKALKSIDPNHFNSIYTKQTKTHLLRFFAKHDPQYFIDDLIEAKKINPGIIDASSELLDPLGDDYYLDVYKNYKEPEIVASLIKTLIKLKRPIAVQVLSENRQKLSDIVWNHEIMNMFREELFIPGLKIWLEKCEDLKDKIDITGALGNCNADISGELELLVNTIKRNNETNCALVRIIGCYGNVDYTDYLLRTFTNKDPILCEAIIYAIGRLMKQDSTGYLRKWYEKEDNNLIKAAAIETIAKYDAEEIDGDVENIVISQDNPYMLSAFIRVIEITKSSRWREYLPQLYNHPLLPIKLCAARSAAAMSDYEYSMDVLEGNYDNIARSMFDEKLFCREPFRPFWLSHPHNFDIELARFPLRITWPDQPVVWLQRNLDMSRVLSRFLGETNY